MVLFLVGKFPSSNRRLHERAIKHRLQQVCTDVQFSRAGARDPGPYRVTGHVSAQAYLDDSSYPSVDARLSVGFDIEQTVNSFDHYWINWVEPSRSFLLGWHQDDTHEELGTAHVQVNYGDEVVDRQPATFVDEHPLAVLEARLEQLPTLVESVEWEDGAPKGIEK